MNIRFIGGLLSAYGLSKDEVGPIACPIRQATYAGGGWGGCHLHILLMLSTDMLDSPPRTNGLSLAPGLHSLSTCTQCVTHVHMYRMLCVAHPHQLTFLWFFLKSFTQSPTCLSCHQVFKRKAVELTNALLPAFNSPSGIPYAIVNPKT